MRYLSHDIFAPGQTVRLGPFSAWRAPGALCDSPRSAIRALQVLELFGERGSSLRAVEILRSLGTSPSSTNQLLKIMVDWGYLIFDPFSKRYDLSPRGSRISRHVADLFFGPDVLEGLMEAARAVLGLSICIFASQGSFMQMVDKRLMPDLYRRESFPEGPLLDDVGLHIPLFGSCTGAAWLSSQPEAVVLKAMRLCRREIGSDPGEAAAILARLREIRRQGHAFGGMIHDERMRGLAMPLPPTRHGIVLVFSISGRTEDMDPHRAEIFEQARGLVATHIGVAGQIAAAS